jgi:hypothetical protein
MLELYHVIFDEYVLISIEKLIFLLVINLFYKTLQCTMQVNSLSRYLNIFIFWSQLIILQAISTSPETYSSISGARGNFTAEFGIMLMPLHGTFNSVI